MKALARGKILVASRELVDPNFVETVVLLVDFSDEGVVGLVLNRSSDVPLSRVFTGPEGLHALGGRLFRGGPVEVKGVLGLVRGTSRPQDRHVVHDIYLINSRESLEAVAASGAPPDRFRVYAGYAGWGAEQLQRETVAGAWSVLDGDAKIVFDRTPDTLWDRLIKRTGGLQADRAGDPGYSCSYSYSCWVLVPSSYVAERRMSKRRTPEQYEYEYEHEYEEGPATSSSRGSPRRRP